MRQQKTIFEHLDWAMVIIYLALVIFGWFNIYAATYNEEHQSIFDTTQSYGKQMMWIITALVLAIIILVIDGRFYEAFSYGIYGFVILLLIGVFFLGKEVKGSHSWIQIGEFTVQPAEFAKFATCMALAKYLSTLDIDFRNLKTKIIAAIIIILPAAIVLMQNETGSALVFAAFVFVLYREGLSQNVLIIGFFAAVLFVLALMVEKTILLAAVASLATVAFFIIGRSWRNFITLFAIAAVASAIIFSVDYIYSDVLKPHQKQRIDVLLGKKQDVKGAGYNVNQSLIAIGSGGLWGKGYLQGTQTKYDFVPEQSTDFIFCTVGEEWGFAGAFILIAIYMFLLYRILYIAERQKSQYTRIYAYGVASIFFFHFMVNIGMTIGLAPVIGIPFPFLSYGGSSLWAFTILLFILVKLDSYRYFILR
jgi:rod shape determining protein RodA